MVLSCGHRNQHVVKALKIARCFPGLCPLGAGPENPIAFYPSLRHAVLNLVVNGKIWVSGSLSKDIV